MAKATFVITDLEEGGFDIQGEFEPEIDSDDPTPAQRVALDIVELLYNLYGGLDGAETTFENADGTTTKL